MANYFYMVVEAIEDYGTGDFRVLAAVDTLEEALEVWGCNGVGGKVYASYVQRIDSDGGEITIAEKGINSNGVFYRKMHPITERGN